MNWSQVTAMPWMLWRRQVAAKARGSSHHRLGSGGVMPARSPLAAGWSMPR